MKSGKKRRSEFVAMMLTAAFLLVVLPQAAPAHEPLSAGETIYVPIYSNVFSGPRGVAFQLSAMLSIHNIDPTHTLVLTSADYYDDGGKLIERYILEPLTLGPLATRTILIKESDTRGGPGANFIVRWRADRKINPPVVEALMLGLRSGQGVSFLTQGRVIQEVE